MAIEVRQALPEDAEGLIALHHRVAADAPYFLAYDMDPASGADILQAKLSAGDDGTGRVFVAASDGRIVGALLARAHAHPAFHGVIQLGLSVDPAARRQGIGRMLLAAAIRWTEAAGCRRLQLAVIASNTAALALFEASGFHAEGIMQDAAEIDGARHNVIPMAYLVD